MFRDDDIDVLKKNIDDIADSAMLYYKTNYEPTISESKIIYGEILSFIEKKKRLIYGGYAQNSLIIMKNKDDGFYKESDTPDIEFYSFEPLVDLIELCNHLHSKNFKYVQGSEGIHAGTYKIFVNFINYCDISYMPKNIYDRCPYIDNNKIRFTHPTFMLIDIYRVFTDPMTSYWRLDKSFKRYLRLYKYYKIDYPPNKTIKFTSKASDNVLQQIRKRIIHNTKYIVVGTYAYNYYIKKNGKDPIDINYYEIITSDIDKEGIKVFEILKKQFGNKITTKEYMPFFEYFDRRIDFLYEDKVILKLYNNNNRCIVYNESETKKTKFGTSHLVLLYLLANYIYFNINKNDIESKNYLILYLDLIENKKDYLDKNNKTVLDTTPFMDFKFNCIGQPVDMAREEKIEIMKRKEKKQTLKFRYDPTGKDYKIPSYIFDNVSGNQIINEKNLLIKK